MPTFGKRSRRARWKDRKERRAFEEKAARGGFQGLSEAKTILVHASNRAVTPRTSAIIEVRRQLDEERRREERRKSKHTDLLKRFVNAHQRKTAAPAKKRQVRSNVP